MSGITPRLGRAVIFVQSIDLMIVIGKADMAPWTTRHPPRLRVGWKGQEEALSRARNAATIPTGGPESKRR